MMTFRILCQGRYYVVPENQRGFSWSAQQVDDLINDLTLSATHSHYMGPVIVSRTHQPDFNDDNYEAMTQYTLEDGQQRITAFFVLANELRLRVIELNGGVSVDSSDLERLIFYKRGGLQRRLTNRYPPLDQYLSYTLTGVPAPPAQRTPPMRAMDVVRQRAKQEVAEKDLSELLSWKAKLLNQAKFVFVDLATENINRYLAFNAINSRGLPLSEFDKLKNFCILVDATRGLSAGVDDAWYKALSNLEAFGLSSRSDEAAFITDLYNSFHNASEGQKGVHDDFVSRYRHLLTRSVPALEGDFKTFVSLWEPYSRSFGFIASKRRQQHYGILCNHAAGIWLNRLDNLDLVTITRMILVSCHLRMSDEDFASVARACEIYTFRLFAVMRRRKDKNSGVHTGIAEGVLRTNRPCDFVLRELCRLLSADAPLGLVLNTLANGEPKYAHDGTMPGWGNCYYFLYEYEVAHSPAGVPPLAWATTYDGKVNSQEHILPQSHRDRSWWEAEWPDEARADRFKHRLGNLVLTSNNSALARKPIAGKLDGPGEHFYNAVRATNSEKRIRLFTEGGVWKEANIISRELEMLRFAAERWGMPCCADNGSVNLPDPFVDETGAGLALTINVATCIAPVEQSAPDEIEED